MPELYGSATLATSAADNVTGIASTSGFLGFPLGHNPDDRSQGLNFDFKQQAGHGLFIGATRAGKFVNILAPALLTCAANAVVTDPKGQAAWETGPRREDMGFRCIYLDPWGEIQRRYGDDAGVKVTVSKFNPLSALDPKSEDFNDDVSTIADALIVVGPDQNTHWTDSARELVAGLIAAVVELNPGKASLRDVRDLVTATDEELVAKIVQIRAVNPRSLAARKLRRFAPKPNSQGDLVISDEIGSIRSTAETQTSILDSEALLSAMETDDPPFNLAELITGKTTLYLVLPPDRMNTHGRWLRMILTLAIRTISRVGKSYQESPCCFWLDEFSSLGNLRMIEDSYGLMAGLGVRIFAFLQDLNQLKRDYPNSWETFISNSSLVQLLQCADQTTAVYFSDRLGQTTINARTGGWTYKQVRWELGEYGRLRHEQEQWIYNHLRTKWTEKELAAKQPGGGTLEQLHTTKFMVDWAERIKQEGRTPFYDTRWVADEQLAPRPVMLPQEVRDADPDKSIIILPGRGNFHLTRWTYYSDPVLSPWARHDPNRASPVIIRHATPVRSTSTPPAPTVDRQPIITPPPANANQPPALGDQLADLGKDLGKKAVGAAASFLKNRLGGG